MRLKELRGLPVIDPTAARKIGTVVDYQIDPASGRLAALDIDGLENGHAERILSQRIRRVGSSAVILTPRGGATTGPGPDINERWLDLSTLVGLDVMGDDGNRIGRLIDASFDQDSLDIEAYVLHASLWEQLIGRRGRIQPAKVHACSRELMMVTTGRLKELPSVVTDETTSLNMPLKPEDRLPTPSFDQVPDGQAVGARR
jgi:sporulation protein YlmC with PRC-barrel domain